MRFRASIVHVVVAGLPTVGCTSSDTTSKPIAKSETVAKSVTPERDVKTDTKPEPPKPEPPKPEPPKPIIVETPDDIPVALGGVAMPYEPPTPPTAPAPAKGDGAAAPAPAPPAAAPEAAAAVEAPARPTAVAIAHQHPPGEPCTPLTRAEVERALTNLRK